MLATHRHACVTEIHQLVYPSGMSRPSPATRPQVRHIPDCLHRYRAVVPAHLRHRGVRDLRRRAYPIAREQKHEGANEHRVGHHEHVAATASVNRPAALFEKAPHPCGNGGEILGASGRICRMEVVGYLIEPLVLILARNVIAEQVEQAVAQSP